MNSEYTIPNLLNIQKVVKLSQPEHIRRFRAFLEENEALMGVKLIDAIDVDILVVESLGELAIKIYGSDDKRNKQSLSQLSLQVFRFTYFLNQNYPHYLHHNLCLIQELLIAGNPEKANLIADVLIELCDKTCDYSLLYKLYQFKAEQAFINRKFNLQVNYLLMAQKVLGFEQTLSDLNINLRVHFNISEKDDSKVAVIDEYLNYFKSYFEHESPVIARFSKYAVIFIHYYYQIEAFRTPELIELVQQFDDEYQKQSFLYCPILNDVGKQVYFMLANQPYSIQDEKLFKATIKKLNQLSKHQLYWKSYINIPELYAITARTTQFINHYQCYNFRDDYKSFVPTDDWESIEHMREYCDLQLNKINQKLKFNADQVHLLIVKAALLICGEQNDRNNGIKILERLMITYQQMSFSMSIDTIMGLLMCGYFSNRKYDDCINTYRRFQKLSKGRVINKQNEISILIYYYFAQWNVSNRHQYLIKIEDLIHEIKSNDLLLRNIDLIRCLTNYFKVPIFIE